ncbi:MAG: hypothetical protein ACFFCS_09565, partial [Candidatus Hodarchaeota archaeon]
MASPIRIFRKLLGYVLIVVNLLLSFISFTAIYSVVYFMGDQNNFHVDMSGADLSDLASPSPTYIYLGTVTVKNTGLFDIDDLSIEFEISLNGTDYIRYNGSWAD